MGVMAPPPSAARYKASDVLFRAFSSLLNAIVAATNDKKVKHLCHFMVSLLEEPSDDYFALFRLLLPNHDRERWYCLKEDALARCLVNACGLDAQGNDDAKRLKGWRKSGSDSNSGNLVEIAYNSIFIKNCGKVRGQSTLTIGQINCQLDILAKAQTNDEKSKVLRFLILELSPEEMKWVLRIILKKSLPLGMGEKKIFGCLHAKAGDVFDFNGQNLRHVCEKCTSRDMILEIQKVRPGQLVRPHLAKRVSSVKEAFEKMKEAEFVVETKFDGERIQLHKDGKQMKYYSRNSVEHGEYSGYSVLDEAFRKQIRSEKCVLDGELIIWNKKYEIFLPFGSLKSVIKALKNHGRNHVLDLLHDGLDKFHDQDHSKHILENVLEDTQVKLADLEVHYMAFDVLFADHEGEWQSVIHLPLKERHKLLAVTVLRGGALDSTSLEVEKSGTTGKIVPLLPEKCPFSRYGTDLGALQRQFDESISQGEEGIVVKALQSKWVPGNRGEEWLKLKPDYINANEIDAIIIGGFFGTGKRGGRLSQYLLGIPKKREYCSSSSPIILSFCKVGNGLTESEQDMIHDLLQDNIVPKDQPPTTYRITGHDRETPDRWVVDPQKSVVLEVKGDIRAVPTNTFACGESLRFPVVTRIRNDKDVFALTSLEEVLEVLKDTENTSKKRKTEKSTPTKGRSRGLSVPEEFLPQQEEIAQRSSSLFSGFLFYLVNCAKEGECSKTHMETLILSHGGKLTQNLTGKILDGSSRSERLCCVANTLDWRGKSLIEKDKDIVSSRWIHDSVAKMKLCEYSPKYYFHLSRGTMERLRLADGFDVLPGESLSPEDLSMLLLRMGSQAKSTLIDNQILTSARESRLGRFYGCQFFLLNTGPSRCDAELREAAAKRRAPPLQNAEHIYNVVMECERFAAQVQLSQATECLECLGGEVCKKWHSSIRNVLIVGGKNSSSEITAAAGGGEAGMIMKQAAQEMDSSAVEDFKQKILTGSIVFYHYSEGLLEQHLTTGEAMQDHLRNGDGKMFKTTSGAAIDEHNTVMEDAKEEAVQDKPEKGAMREEGLNTFDETVADLDDFISSFI